MQELLSDEFKGILFGVQGWRKPSQFEAEEQNQRLDHIAAQESFQVPWSDAWPNNDQERRPCDFCNKMKPINVECSCKTLRDRLHRRPFDVWHERQRDPYSQESTKFDQDELLTEKERLRISENAMRVLQSVESEVAVKAEEPRKQGTQDYIDLLDRMRDLHIRKNTGYSGHSDDTWYNFRACERWGGDSLEGVMHRMTDKWSRLESLTMNEGNDQVGEPMCDTLMDLAAYSLIMICLRQERGLT